MRILIVEPQTSGHYLVYVKLLVEHLKATGHTPVVALRQKAQRTVEFRLHLRELLPEHERVVLRGAATPRSVRRLARYVRASITVVPNGDRFLTRIALGGWRSDGRLVCLVMQDPRLRSHEPLSVRMQQRVKMVCLRIASRRRSVTVAWLRGPGDIGSPGEFTVNDPVLVGHDDRFALVPELSDLDQDIPWLGMVGGLTRRKHPLLAIRAFRTSGLEGKAGLLLFGNAPDELADELGAEIEQGAPGSVVWCRRVLSNQEMNAVVAFLGAVILPYGTSAPPSTLGKAAVLGTRVVMAGSDAFRDHGRRLGVGVVEADLEVDDLARAMRVAVEHPRPSRRPELATSVFGAQMLDNIIAQVD